MTPGVAAIASRSDTAPLAETVSKASSPIASRIRFDTGRMNQSTNGLGHTSPPVAPLRRRDRSRRPEASRRIGSVSM